MPSHFSSVLISLATVIAAGCAGPGSLDEDETFVDREPVSCISMQRIQTTEVIDDSTILFLGLGNVAYVNHLETECPTLKANGLFRYRIDSGILTARLCDSQSITVIDRATDALTNNCRLGVFQPVSREEADTLLGIIPRLPEGVVETTDLPVEEAGDEGDSNE